MGFYLVLLGFPLIFILNCVCVCADNLRHEPPILQNENNEKKKKKKRKKRKKREEFVVGRRKREPESFQFNRPEKENSKKKMK